MNQLVNLTNASTAATHATHATTVVLHKMDWLSMSLMVFSTLLQTVVLVFFT